MEGLSLLEKFVDSELIRELSLGNKVLATFYVTIMGMAITFFALSVLWGFISLMSVFAKPGRKKKPVLKTQIEPKKVEISKPAEITADSGEVIAAITAALTEAIGSPLPTIRVHSISRQGDSTPEWGKVGRIEQLIGN